MNEHESDASKQWNLIDILTIGFEQIPECVIQGLWTIAMLHWSFIPWEFEVRMSSVTTMKQKGSYGRRGNTESDVTISINGSSNGLANMGLSTASSAVKEEDISLIVLGRVDNIVKGNFLLRV